ncbi:MAG TPA: hypothetical protein VM841_02590 [Actinomycetota bacterium]|nr:hypothetical protein [Actinomycetota bacterium]
MLDVSISASARDRATLVADALHRADAAMAEAIRLLGSGNGIAAATGLPAERILQLDGRLTGADARMLSAASDVLRFMPSLTAAFDCGVVSWSQVRSIVCAVRNVPSAVRDQIDTLIAEHADTLSPPSRTGSSKWWTMPCCGYVPAGSRRGRTGRSPQSPSPSKAASTAGPASTASSVPSRQRRSWKLWMRMRTRLVIPTPRMRQAARANARSRSYASANPAYPVPGPVPAPRTGNG